jgi:hypothetical protein
MNTLLNTNLAAVFVVYSVIGVAYAHLVKYSVAMIMYLTPDLLACGLTGPTNSMAHF